MKFYIEKGYKKDYLGLIEEFPWLLCFDSCLDKSNGRLYINIQHIEEFCSLAKKAQNNLVVYYSESIKNFIINLHNIKEEPYDKETVEIRN